MGIPVNILSVLKSAIKFMRNGGSGSQFTLDTHSQSPYSSSHVEML